MRHSLILAAVAVLVAGCSDPKAANEKNLKVAMQSYLDTAYPRCYILQKFPTTVQFVEKKGSQQEKETLRTLTKAGLLFEKEIERKEIKDIFDGGGMKALVKVTFDLTDEGKKYYKNDVQKNFKGEGMGGFCFGKATVKAITQFSEPGDMLGQKVSRVNYEYTVSDLPKWATSPEVTSSINSLKADAESNATPVKALNAAILTNNGWVHERLFQK